jgi:hypothetical protein
MTEERTSMAPNKPDLFYIWLIRESLIRGALWISLSWHIRLAMMIEFGAEFRSVLPGKSAADA